MLNIIFEDSIYLVLEKRSKQHTSIGKNQNSLSEEIINYMPLIKDVGDINNAGLISRLDFETSGLILAVKQDIKISAQKTYLAIVDGLLEKEIKSNLYIGQSSRNSKKVRVFDKEPKKNYRAKISETIITPLGFDQETTLIKASIKNGFRHQIRSHCAFYGHPLTGDQLYGSTSHTDFILHSYQINFKCPIKNKILTFKSKIPNSIIDKFPKINL